ncbi:MAG: TolC family protein, partial [Rickettsiales bacterium]|nr:TolC family protein [Rickettsiales bacterium]
LNQKAISRVSGFYSGDYADTQVTRRLSSSATRIYGGYRASDGDFPVYEDENVTLNRGEFNAGVALSLWRNRIIDEERFTFTDAELELKQKSIDLLLTQMGVQYDAMQAYIEWVAAGQALKVTENMLKLAVARQEGFKTRVGKGDLADIVLTENQQYIAKRTADVNDAKRNLENKASRLSLFWRNTEGAAVLPARKDLPGDFPKAQSFAIDLNREIERARAIRPELIKLDVGMQRARNKLALSEQRIMPKVDLIAEGGRDMGRGASRYAGNEAKIGLNISIPLQQNIGEGQMRQSRALIRQLEQDRRLLNDKIATEIQIAANNYHAAQQNVVQAKKEIDATLAMQVADRERFDSGAVDFFVLNMREERAADAQIKHIESRLRLWRSIADYYLASLQAEKLLLKPVS